MKKIMFNDKYGLTQAVLEGRKTITRRLIPQKVIDAYYDYEDAYCSINFGGVTAVSMTDFLCGCSRYYLGDVLAIAQAYQDIYNGAYHVGLYRGTAGWINKMFVKADLMPNHIKITNIRVEHLQDISDDDCLREGIRKWDHNNNPFPPAYDFINSPQSSYKTPREAFAALIDKVSGKGTWESNPYVWVYEFEPINSKE